MTRDSAVAHASGRSASRGIVLAGDRTESRKSARRHSTAVRVLKIALPLTAISIAGFFSMSIMKMSGWGDGLPSLAMPKIVPENLTMQNPHYEGFNKDGGRYWVKAANAQQDLKSLTLIKLNGISGELIDAKKLRTTLAAKRGTFDSKANVLELYDSIDVAGDAGMTAHLTRATVDTKENIITSREPVVVMMEAGKISANQMTARQKAKEYTFVDNVRTHINARDAKPGATPAPKTDAMIGSSNAPVDVASNRLDVNDNTKTALFTGMVTATQDGSSMTTPELEVSYEGSAAPGAGDDPKTASKVKRLVAKNPVVLKQANGDTVTSQAADFDPVAQRAVLEGDVVMLQAPDKRATADRAEVDQATNSVLLTGEVVVMQGQNVLKGKRLAFNRGNGKMQLTALAPAGRISAKFHQNQAGQAPASKKPELQSQGIPFGASFKSDPNAPVAIDATRLDVDDTAKQAVFSGDVRAVQGDFVIRAAELTASYSGSAGLNTSGAEGQKQTAAQLNRIKAKTKVQITSKDDQSATGDWADFDTKANMATLGGNVVLKQGKNVVRGTKLVIDMTTGETVINNDAPAGTAAPVVSQDGTATGAASSSGRPTATFYIDQLKAKVPKAATGAAGSAWNAETTPSARP